MQDKNMGASYSVAFPNTLLLTLNPIKPDAKRKVETHTMRQNSLKGVYVS